MDRAAHSVGRTASGAWKVRSSAGAEGFSDAWDAALDLFHARNPGLSRRGGRAIPGARGGPRPAPEPQEPELDEEAEWQEFSEGILAKYVLKLNDEREARLAGRIVEADFLVRQLSWLEVALDLAHLGPKVVDLLNGLKRGSLHAGQIVATPMSAFLADLRRAYWAKCEEPERPAPAPLGRHDEALATGEPGHWEYDRSVGTDAEWRAAEAEKARLNAEAQQAWERRAKADAEAWAKREARD